MMVLFSIQLLKCDEALGFDSSHHYNFQNSVQKFWTHYRLNHICKIEIVPLYQIKKKIEHRK